MHKGSRVSTPLTALLLCGLFASGHSNEGEVAFHLVCVSLTTGVAERLVTCLSDTPYLLWRRVRYRHSPTSESGDLSVGEL